MKNRTRIGAAAFALAAVLAAAPAPARAEGTAYNGVVGLGSALATLVWAPMKVGSAVGGTVLSGAVFLLTFDPELTTGVFRTTVGGDYVVTPSHLQGDEEFHFRGDR